MKSSVRSKLFFSVSGLIIFYVLVSWILNTWFLDDYYYMEKKNLLLDSYRLIDENYNGDPSELSLELEQLERSRGMMVVIMDGVFGVKYTSRPGNQGPMRQGQRERFMLGSDIEGMHRVILTNPEKGAPSFERRGDQRLNTDFLNMLAVLNNGEYLFISTPVSPIRENTSIASKFYIFTGLITMIPGIIIVSLLAKRFTRPLLELNEIAQGMAGLDFAKRYRGNSEDEIGELGKSVNSLSEQLEISISELKAANKKLLEDIEKERKIDEMRKAFISNVSHELKTPIALIQGYAEGLKVNVNQDEESKNFYCEVIMDETLKMNRLVRELLDLAQLESAGSSSLDITDFDISGLIGQILKKSALIFERKGIRPMWESKGEIMAKGDVYRIEQVIMNYINNALNHVDENKAIRIKAEEKNEKIRVSVYNSGSPIPETIIEDIWSSFYKADKARSREYGGTGLGLSVVRAVQEAHKNSYGVLNRDKGVEFWFDIHKAGF